jgi:hypothetical protein
VALRIDESRAPVLVIELFGRIDHADVKLFLATGERYISQRRPYAFVFVPRSLAVPSYAELKTMLMWMREHRADLDLWFRAMALVTDSAVMRGAMRGVLVLSPLRAPQLVTDDIHAAIEWAEQLLRASIS